MGSIFITSIAFNFEVFHYFRIGCTGLTLIAIKTAVIWKVHVAAILSFSILQNNTMPNTAYFLNI